MWLVTGGAGFIGSHLVQRLLADGEEVRVLDDLSTGSMDRIAPIQDQIDFIQGDLRDPATIAAAIQGVQYVLHQAAQPSVPLSVLDPAHTYAVNTMGTLHLLQAARAAGVERVVMASTSAIYGNDPTSPKSEQLPPAPVSPYASSKLSTESMGAVFTKAFGLECVLLRYFNVYGPGQDPNSAYAAAIPKFLDSMGRGEQPIIFGDGLQTRDFIYVGDVVRANLLAATSSAGAGRVYNIATGTSVTILEIVHAVAERLGITPEITFAPVRMGDVLHSLADVRKAEQELGFVAETSLADGLDLTVGAHRMAAAA
ncbi:MAG TPA: SDR family oxidoreductase [Thermomicrobiales bacterium]|nr:SDR family oxidoreductase [Thermomicrobiales bacterium]HRA48978.1 SDR family oxidoreductase [Thermomicrobiales bacterium]